MTQDTRGCHLNLDEQTHGYTRRDPVEGGRVDVGERTSAPAGGGRLLIADQTVLQLADVGAGRPTKELTEAVHLALLGPRHRRGRRETRLCPA